ncbi:putative glycosylphosphatidylinositol-alpha 1,2 mannosyltransferase [Aspergillus aculeatinus CBS 121060]|uniref:Uncharacterized protein n=1 Tax=Aspergillus aculeatinus CBS 121060 TaxID=1448322 RepID=A0ACD1HJR2_9EURO|nr:hypothetical protein BO66DRAFT_456805 [Aspergillus aculeatinus CBS 121060]RAH74094.1 hypothetical protein BO66DRAFT_456805 [Aspergillus aculeatinus CBS 121060]
MSGRSRASSPRSSIPCSPSSVSPAVSLASGFPSDDPDGPLYLPRQLRPRTPTPSPPRFPILPSPPDSLRVFLYLLAFRLLNALTTRTFFQPDEYFQSLEPAWQAAFGENHGAWITWEWRHQLRSSLHPLFFTAVYSAANGLACALHLSPAWQADLLIAAPKTAQAVIAALGDYYTWKLARCAYGLASAEASAALALTALSPWQWFCSTRTLSNCLETTLTVIALYLWPWQWSVAPKAPIQAKPTGRVITTPWDKVREGQRHRHDKVVLGRLRQCLPLAALACILRPTNVLVWLILASVVLHRSTWARRKLLAREAAIWGAAVLAVSIVADRLFYGIWTFPPLRFLYFNIAQSLAVFYGRNDWHYYLSQGYPLLLTTALPFTFVGLYRVWARSQAAASHDLQVETQTQLQTQLTYVCLSMPLVLSLISHKEVRFIYPLLPALHVLTSPVLVDFFGPAVTQSVGRHIPRRLLLVFLVLCNVVIGLYTTVYHASGPNAVFSYLRDQRRVHGSKNLSNINEPGIIAGFLMPCHSTPWRSHMVYPSIDAWALSCEPPIGMNATEKAEYRDEADQFYDDPSGFLRANMAGGLSYFPRRPSYQSHLERSRSSLRSEATLKHNWPDYLIFFAQMEPTLKKLLRGSSYGECWRTHNTDWHDDWRRQGDIVVWCLDTTEQLDWRTAKRSRQLQQRGRVFNRVVQAIKNQGQGGRLQWSFPWTSLRPQSSSWSWLWPWYRRPKHTVLGFEVPDWLDRLWDYVW